MNAWVAPKHLLHGGRYWVLRLKRPDNEKVEQREFVAQYFPGLHQLGQSLVADHPADEAGHQGVRGYAILDPNLFPYLRPDQLWVECSRGIDTVDAPRPQHLDLVGRTQPRGHRLFPQGVADAKHLMSQPARHL